MNKLKIGGLYLLLGAGAVWHLLDMFQITMRFLASPIMIGLAAWLFWECWRLSPTDNRVPFSLWSVGVIIGGFGAEWLGVQTGQIFGVYAYQETLRPAIAGIPVSIGCAWFSLLVTSGAVVQKVAPAVIVRSPFRLACAVAALMVCFDLFMEPAAVKLGYWTWADDTVPLRNYVAWFGLGFIFASLGVRAGVFRHPMPRLVFHAYFAQLAYFGVVALQSL